MENSVSIDIPLVVSKTQEIDHRRSYFISIKEADVTKEADGIIFFKPEICNISSEKLTTILNYFKNMTNRYEISLQSAYIISGEFLIENKIIDQNYEKIREYSLLSIIKGDNSKSVLSCNLEIYDCHAVMGGLFLAQQGYSPEFLMDLWINSGSTTKIDDDMYGVPCFLDDKKIMLINGFFPYQIQQYKNNHSKIIFFTFNTKEQFSILKKYFQGTAENTNRYKFSMRQYLAEFMDNNLIGQITTSQNGIHMSGNYEEGVREARIFIDALHKQMVRMRGNH